ncbi:hypothetical protein UFOVP28_29 [uncultured Caudovirales phage]|uniref:Uncharacterized protein n=1 Tax=uncultured Caudovirales phage TaxID=2100421 RepID=A0A6J5KQZ5_9CAUD|nr:hypothetical protein UFOVP28_29 [uncultured Caudovirales phage]
MISKARSGLAGLADPSMADPDGDQSFEMNEPPMSLDDGVLNDDGSMTFGAPDDDEPATQAFTDNLASYLDDGALASIGIDLMDKYREDMNSRKDWEDAYLKGLDLLGVKSEDRTIPWNGACGVYHPVLMEAVVRFQAQTIMELFPPQGPAKVKLIGTETPELQATADRVKNELNHILVESMEDYRDETEALLFRVAMAGSAFRKVYYDGVNQVPCAKFVPAEDLIVAYGETNLRTCGRIAYVDRISRNELRRRQAAGFYIDADLSDPVVDHDKVDEKEGEIIGIKPGSTHPDRYTIIEFHVDYDIDTSDSDSDEEEELPAPYIIHIEKESARVLGVYRNWEEGDPLKKKKNYFIHYKYVPGLGFYGFGLIHIIGGLAKSSTGILRQLVDAGTLSNLPGGLKSRGLRIKGDDSPIRPGEFRDVDVMSGDISKNITFLPYKEPSQVLYNLLGNIVDEARRVGSIADMNVGDMKQEAPVGTTLALMERAMKVMSAVQARCHSSLQQELKLIQSIVKNFMGPQYSYNVGGDFDRQKDFGSVDVVPVSDPGATTMSQRVVQYQAVIQLATQNPQIYDMRKLNMDMLNVLGIKDAQTLIPDPAANMQPTDPVTENMSILKGSPAKAFQFQDHDSHIAVHMAMVNDPKIKQFVSQTPQAATSVGSMYAHIAEHMAFKYRADIEKQLGTELPPLGQPLPPEVETHLSSLVAKAAEQVLENSKTEEQKKANEAAQQDPMIQLQTRELDIKQAAIDAKKGADTAKLILDSHKSDQLAEIEMAKIAAQQGQALDRSKIELMRVKGESVRNQMSIDQQNKQAHLSLIGTLASTTMNNAARIQVEKLKPDPSPPKPGAK